MLTDFATLSGKSHRRGDGRRRRTGQLWSSRSNHSKPFNWRCSTIESNNPEGAPAPLWAVWQAATAVAALRGGGARALAAGKMGDQGGFPKGKGDDDDEGE